MNIGCAPGPCFCTFAKYAAIRFVSMSTTDGAAAIESSVAIWPAKYVSNTVDASTTRARMSVSALSFPSSYWRHAKNDPTTTRMTAAASALARETAPERRRAPAEDGVEAAARLVGSFVDRRRGHRSSAERFGPERRGCKPERLVAIAGDRHHVCRRA